MPLTKAIRVKNLLSQYFVTITAIFISIGVILIIWTSNDESWVGNHFLQNSIREIGGFLAISFSISLIWDLFGRNRLLREVLATVRLSDEIALAGLVSIIESFPDYDRWDEHFQNSSELDIFFSYGSAWRSQQRFQIDKFVSKRGNKIRVVMPDPNDSITIEELARRFDYETNKLKSKIMEAEEEFRKLAKKASKSGASVEIWYIPAAPVYSFYRFDNILIFSLFTHQKDKIVKVPSFECEKRGNLYNYFKKEFEVILNEDRKLTRKIQ